MNDISVFGIRVQLVASETFPAGISLTQFADDADPFDTHITPFASRRSMTYWCSSSCTDSV